MDNLTTFELIAGSASILALVLSIGSYTLKLWRTFKQKREKTEKEFKQEIDRLLASGSTVSARTDLGFFVLIELASLREDTDFYRHHRTWFTVFLGILLLILNSMNMGEVFDRFLFVYYAIVLFFLIMILIVHTLVMRSQKYSKSYEDRVKDVWQRAIDKRAIVKDS